MRCQTESLFQDLKAMTVRSATATATATVEWSVLIHRFNSAAAKSATLTTSMAVTVECLVHIYKAVTEGYSSEISNNISNISNSSIQMACLFLAQSSDASKHQQRF